MQGGGGEGRPGLAWPHVGEGEEGLAEWVGGGPRFGATCCVVGLAGYATGTGILPTIVKSKNTPTDKVRPPTMGAVRTP